MKTEPVKSEKTLFEIVRSDGRVVPRYAFETRAEAKACIAEMYEPERMPFQYRIREVKGER